MDGSGAQPWAPAGWQESANDTDDDLVARARSDPQAFAALYDKYQDSVYRYCDRRMGNREEAEDAAAQVFLKALTALSAYRGESFRGWLFTIAHNAVVDSVRQRKPEDPLGVVEVVSDDLPNPEQVDVVEEERRSLRELLSRLSGDQRAVVELRLAGLSGAEIAQALGHSPGSVKMLQYRAVGRLREWMQIKAPRWEGAR